MGYGHTYTCKKFGKTGDVFLDVGMSYPCICEEAFQAAQSGEMGLEWAQFTHDHPYGAFDCSCAIFVCDCGYWHSEEKKDWADISAVTKTTRGR